MKRVGDKASATVESKVAIKSARLNYAIARGPWQTREWKSLPADFKDGHIEALLPTERPLVYFLTVVDERGLETSAPHAEEAPLGPR
jgi:hypothetical protein